MIYRSIRKDQWIEAYLDFQNTGPLLKLYKLSWLGGSSVVSKDILFSWLGGSAVKATDEPPSRRATKYIP